MVDTGLSSWWAPALAFVAGVVSFASPCVLPLVPGYVSFVTGSRATEGEGRRPLVPILLFILGFTIVFTLLGAFAGTFVQFFKAEWFQRIAGLIVVGLGLLMLGYAFRRGSPGLYSERRPLLERVRPGRAGAFPLGIAFAAGWTPCIGPVLAGILAIAASGGTVKGAALLVVYSLGLGLPFLLVGIGADRLVRSLGWVKRHYRVIAGVSGALLVVVGVLLMTGLFRQVFGPLARFAPGL
ncbi:MAG TPA: cytochrome c biogenesis protein CcdA [Actinomycetota bacterium]|nr:cytochrome c biogenesis protein CcdA [Actinomycetota bacterium]